MTRLVLGLFVAVACALRLPSLPAGLWRDEGSTYFDIGPATAGGVLREVRLAEFSPPGYFLVMHLWSSVAGTSEVALRLPSLAFGLATIPAAYLLARSFASRNAALLAAAFVTASPVAAAYSDEARPYALAALLAAIATVLAFRVQTGDARLRTLAAYAAVATALAYVHYTGLMVFAALAIAAVPSLFDATSRASAVRFSAANAVVLLAYVPQLLVLLPLHHECFGYLASVSGGALPGRFVEQVGFALPVVFMRAQYALVLTIACALASFSRDFRVRSLAACVLLVALVETQQLLREARYTFVLTPLVDALLAWFCSPLLQALVVTARERSLPRARIARAAGGLALVATLLAGIPAQSRTYTGILRALPRSGMRDLVAQNRSAFDAKTLVIVAPDYLGSSLRYYVRDPAVRIAGIPAWDAPEHVRCLPDAWRSARFVDDAVARILAGAARMHARRVAFVWDLAAADRGTVPYSRILAIRQLLLRRFSMRAERRYPASLESVGLTVVALDMRS